MLEIAQLALMQASRAISIISVPDLAVADLRRDEQLKMAATNTQTRAI